ncbi:molybdopterin molybdotransferase MoeA [Myxococcota bacterium]|nr:molybdopterin molybdotransferase MoeA [Myxococcota bacterium]
MRESITPSEARAIIQREVAPLGSERVALPEALGRVLCESVVAPRNLPPADNSAMDGYALRASDVAGADSQAPVDLPIAFEIPAGVEPEQTLQSGNSARILTGAFVPAGADCVIRQEDVERIGDRIRVKRPVPHYDNIRRAGEDVGRGDEVLSAGKRLGPGEIGMLASLGRTIIAVHQRPRVAIVSGGDELVEPDGDVSGGRIVSSNSYSLAAQCMEIGAEPVYLGIARDTPEDIEEHFRTAMRADVIVSSAGVSVGDRDHVRSVLEKLGCSLLFWGVRMKPGYPLAFGRFEREAGPLVFGLPGNPVSAMVTFEQFVRPALLAMMGSRNLYRATVRARLTEPLTKTAGRLHFVRVHLERDGGVMTAHSTGNQSSGALRSMTLAQGLLIFPADETELSEGQEVEVQVIDPDFLASSQSGF